VLPLLLLTMAAQAKSWCASPLTAHEWGVAVLRTDGVQPEGVALPSWLHREALPIAPAERPVRHRDVDSGVRTLPVVQFYSPARWGDSVPVGLEVGFRQGEASLWFPQVDRRVPASIARGPAAEWARQDLLLRRAARPPFGRGPYPPLPSDPTRQLHWDALFLSQKASPPSHPAEVPWVDALRQMPGALWVHGMEETERFVFYEADTEESPAVLLERGASWSPTHPHYQLRNGSDWPVHDVLVVADGQAWRAPSIPAGATAGFLLEEPLEADVQRAWLRDRWTDHAVPAPPKEVAWEQDDCVMGQDPALPVEAASGHRLYAAEIDVVLDVWAERLLASEGVHLVYREDPEALDALMPISVYTDMFHHVDLRRLGVVLVEGLSLP